MEEAMIRWTKEGKVERLTWTSMANLNDLADALDLAVVALRTQLAEHAKAGRYAAVAAIEKTLRQIYAGAKS